MAEVIPVPRGAPTWASSIAAARGEPLPQGETPPEPGGSPAVGQSAEFLAARQRRGPPGGAAGPADARLRTGPEPGGAPGPAVVGAGPPPGGGDTAGTEPEGGAGAPGADADASEAEPPPPRGLCTAYGNFLVYPDAFVGPLPPPDAEKTHVRERELAGVLAERKAEAEARLSRVVASVDELLSYGAFDWAITDAEALKALQLLGGLPLRDLGAALGRIDSGRLLDNLPDAGKRDPAYTKIVVALGPDRVRAYIEDLLSYGLFDWAVTDDDVKAVVTTLQALEPGQRAQLVAGLAPQFLSRLAANLPDDLADDDYKTLFRALPDSDVEGLKATLGKRFGIKIGGIEGKDWTSDALRRAWTILEKLPPEHVKGNDRLDELLRDASADGSGYYAGGKDRAVIGYSDISARKGYGAIMVDDGTGTGATKDVGLHTDVNLFDTVVRHEIGHAVDARLNATGPGSFCRKEDSGGKWETYGSKAAFADALVAMGMSGHGYADAAAYELALRKAVADDMDFNDALQALKAAKQVKADVAPAAAGVRGPVSQVYETARWQAAKSPWYKLPDRADVGGRLFQESYGGGSSYVSFRKATRTETGVSSYQFRAPGEWFAEAYAAYYSDHDRPDKTPAGTKLRARDPKTAEWFDKNVDRIASLQQQTNQAAEVKGGPETAPEGAGGGAGSPGPRRATGGGGGKGA